MNPTIDPVQQFFSMWARANTAVWPMQVVWYAAAVAAMGLALRPIRGSNRLIAGFLAVYYIWLGIVFFGIFYSPLSDHALAAGAMFVLGGVLFLVAGVLRQDLTFQPKWGVLGVTGGAFMLYALAYPVMDALTGHVFPAQPLFGIAPCPSAIFTVGLLLWSRPRLPMYVLVVPLFWLFAQAPADAIAMGVVADVARAPVGLLGAGLLIFREYRALRERLLPGALVLLALLALGHDETLIALGLVILVGYFAQWLLHQTRRGTPFSRGTYATPTA